MKVDWVTWLGSDLTHDGSDTDLDFNDIEEEEELDDMSDNELCDLDLDQVQILCELYSELSQAQVAAACHVRERKRLQDKIGELEQQFEFVLRAAASELSAKEALEASVKGHAVQAGEALKALEASNIALAEVQRQLKWHQDQTDWVHQFYRHGGPPPPPPPHIMARMRKLCSL